MQFSIHGTKNFFCYVLLLSFPLMAQEEQQLIQRMEQSSSPERILALSIYCDDNVFSKRRTPESFNFLFKEAYRIASRDNDKEFIEYLDFCS
jgi:hypothetical protein